MQTKLMKKVFCIVSAFVVIALLFSLPVFAETVDCPMCGNTHETGDLGNWRFVYDMFKSVYGGGSIRDLGLNGILGLDVTQGAFSSIWTTISSAYTVIKTVGLTLVIIFFSTELFDLYAEDRLNAELFIRVFIKLVVSILIMENGFQIVEIFIGMSSLIFDKLTDGVSSTLATNHCNYNYLLQAGLFEGIGELGKIVVPYATLSATLMVMQFFCYLRLIDVLVKTLFAPIGMADLGFKGTSGSGWRYLKKLMASALQGGVMLIILFVQSLLAINANWFVTLILYITMIMTFRKASAIASDILGV
jgi:hypothetical protein